MALVGKAMTFEKERRKKTKYNVGFYLPHAMIMDLAAGIVQRHTLPDMLSR